jgi:hypothetical protein
MSDTNLPTQLKQRNSNARTDEISGRKKQKLRMRSGEERKKEQEERTRRKNSVIAHTRPNYVHCIYLALVKITGGPPHKHGFNAVFLGYYSHIVAFFKWL